MIENKWAHKNTNKNNVKRNKKNKKTSKCNEDIFNIEKHLVN